MKRPYALAPALLAIAAAFFTSCTDLSDNRNLPLSRSGYALVLLNLGYPGEVATARPTLVDRLRRLFVGEAHAQLVPPAFISNATVRIQGADIGIIEQTFTGTPVTVISCSVPAGANRLIEVIAEVAPTDPSGAASFRGTVVASLSGGATVSLPVAMSLYESRIIIADYQNITRRLLKLNGLSASGAVNRTATFFTNGFGTNFAPYDADVDNRGRIYIANYITSASADAGIWRLNSFNDTAPQQLVSNAANVISVAVDRSRKYLYYATSVGLFFRDNLDSGAAALISSSFSPTRGIAVEEGTGYVYIAHGTSVSVYNRPANSTVATLAIPDGSQAWDVAIKGANAYVAVYNAAGTYGMIHEYQLPLTTTGRTLRYQPGTANSLYGVTRLPAVLARRFYLADERYQLNDPDNRIVGFDDFGTGTGWGTVRGQDIGVGQFYFWQC